MKRRGNQDLKKERENDSISMSFRVGVEVLADCANVLYVSVIDSGNFSGA